MNYKVQQLKSGRWIAYAKSDSFVTSPVDPVREPGNLWFEFGWSYAEAYFKITDEMINEGLEVDFVRCMVGPQ